MFQGRSDVSVRKKLSAIGTALSITTFFFTLACGSSGNDDAPNSSQGDAATSGTPDGNTGPSLDAALPIAPAPFFLQHWSDTQIGSGSFAEPAFAYLLGEVKPAFGSIPIVLTGDLVEDGDDGASWATYRNMVDGAGLTYPNFIEVPGNHDAYPFASLSDYDTHSVAGRSGAGRSGITDLERANRHIRVIGLNTADGNILQVHTGYLKSMEIDALIDAVDADPRIPDATLVLGHHSMDDPESLPLLGADDEVKRLIDHTNATAYLFGHRHIYATHWNDGVLMSQASTVGNPADNVLANGEAGFTVFAIDNQGPVVKHVGFYGDADSVHTNWPIVMITTPVNPNMTVDAPYDDLAYPPITTPMSGLPRNASAQPVRVGVFAPSPVGSVVLQIDGGEEIAMTKSGEHYEAVFDTPDAASCTLRVTATSMGDTNSDSYEINLN